MLQNGSSGAAPCPQPERSSSCQGQAGQKGISLSQRRLLEEVYLHPGCTQKALSGRLDLPKQRVNLLVRELKERDLLYLSRSENDGRSRPVCLTEQGRAVAEESLAPSFGEPHTHLLEDGTVVTHTHGGQAPPHAHRQTKAVLDRLARCIGHLEKVRQMVEAGVDCSEVLIQLSAVKAAVNSTGKLILKDHIEHCLVEAVEHGDRRTVEELNKAIDQFIK